ncbi:hypothetical protein I317_06534 [Kwoniella heveanensis CBS 569]|nr:hypothetical protein I317_06534 [Kwoniella heveanensis CBS 569]
MPSSPLQRVTRSSCTINSNKRKLKTASPAVSEHPAEGKEEIDLERGSSDEESSDGDDVDERPRTNAGPGPNTMKKQQGTSRHPHSTAKKRIKLSTISSHQRQQESSALINGSEKLNDAHGRGSKVEQEESAGIGEVDWLKIGEEFPWPRIVFYFDVSVGSDMTAHLTKRIKKAKGKTTSIITEADIILINPHPSRLSPARLNLLSSLDQVMSNDCLILSYHWLSRCYFSKTVERWISDIPVFVMKKGEMAGLGMKVAVGKLGEGQEGDQLRKRVMTDLEMNGAMIVPNEEATTCILTTGHPMLTDPPQDGSGANCSLHPPEWVQERIARFKERQKRGIKPSDVLEMSKVKVTRAGIGKNKPTAFSSPVKKDKVELKQPRSAHRHEFIAHDREMLARWLAFKRPEKTGRTTRSIYEELGACSRKHPYFSWASRHTPSAWHEHFKRTRGKVGNDGKILEEEVERYVKQGIDESLKTLRERTKGAPPSIAAGSSKRERGGRSADGDKGKRPTSQARKSRSMNKGEEERCDLLKFSKDESEDEDGSLEVIDQDHEHERHNKRRKTVHHEADKEDGSELNDDDDNDNNDHENDDENESENERKIAKDKNNGEEENVRNEKGNENGKDNENENDNENEKDNGNGNDNENKNGNNDNDDNPNDPINHQSDREAQNHDDDGNDNANDADKNGPDRDDALLDERKNGGDVVVESKGETLAADSHQEDADAVEWA